jgi:hypothetical protein
MFKPNLFAPARVKRLQLAERVYLFQVGHARVVSAVHGAWSVALRDGYWPVSRFMASLHTSFYGIIL